MYDPTPTAEAEEPEQDPRAPEATARYLAFSVGEDGFALPLDAVHSLLRPVPVTPVPFTPPAMLGVIALHGAIVPLLDLARCLGIGESAPEPGTRFLVVDDGGLLRAVVVRRLQEVLTVRPADLLPEIESPVGTRPACVRQLLRLGERLYSVLDPARLGDFLGP